MGQELYSASSYSCSIYYLTVSRFSPPIVLAQHPLVQRPPFQRYFLRFGNETKSALVVMLFGVLTTSAIPCFG
jgi:hypothetical protein